MMDDSCFLSINTFHIVILYIANDLQILTVATNAHFYRRDL